MPLTKMGEGVLGAMKKEYGDKKGEEVFYASINKRKPGSDRWHNKTSSQRRLSGKLGNRHEIYND